MFKSRIFKGVIFGAQPGPPSKSSFGKHRGLRHSWAPKEAGPPLPKPSGFPKSGLSVPVPGRCISGVYGALLTSLMLQPKFLVSSPRDRNGARNDNFMIKSRVCRSQDWVESSASSSLPSIEEPLSTIGSPSVFGFLCTIKPSIITKAVKIMT